MQPPWTRDAEVQISIGKTQGDQIHGQQRRVNSHSAPIYAEKFDPAERIREMRAAVQKLNTHVLPTPADAKSSFTSGSASLSSSTVNIGSSKNLWHSSPLDVEKQKKVLDDRACLHGYSKSQIPVEDNNDKHSHPLPRPLPEVGSVRQPDTQSGSDTWNFKRQAFSGPLASKPSSNKPVFHTSGPMSFTEASQSTSGLPSRISVSQAPSSVNVSHNSSPPLISSPKISELHELPRPPDSFSSRPMRTAAALGHSAPLVNRNPEVPMKRYSVHSVKGGSPLPLPQLTVSRSFSIPSSSQRAMTYNSGKLLDSSKIVHSKEDVSSPPLTPMSLTNMKSPNSGQIRGEMNTA